MNLMIIAGVFVVVVPILFIVIMFTYVIPAYYYREYKLNKKWDKILNNLNKD